MSNAGCDSPQVFHFNFKNWRENLSPGQEALEFTVRSAAGEVEGLWSEQRRG